MKTLSGQTIRGYEIGERIGSGGYGEIYRAIQLSVERDVAIKIILPQYANDPKFVAEFEAEARLVAQLEHTNIVPLHDYWQDAHGAFLVMRYVRGGTVKDMIDRQGALPLTRTMRLIEQIADALQTAHDANVIHGDLKPANILIDQRGSAYLTDFGIAKQLSGDDISGESGAVKGTFAYMSPEQIQGDKVSPQTDIYALGVILYEMLAGRHPFDETPVGSLLIKHMQEQLPDIYEVRDDLPPGIGAVIQKATAKAPSDRYSIVLELVSDLKTPPAGKLHPAVTAKTKPATLEERNRQAMLTNVRKFWVEGVLENSLHNTAMVELGLKLEADAVDNPWDTLIQTPSGTKSLTDESILEVFDRLNGKLLILGDPGSGKTTTLLALTRDLLIRAEADNAHPIPVVLNLSSWSENQLPLKEWLVEELNARYQVPRRVGTAWIADDELLLLLDGLDEVVVQVRDACVEAINAFRNEHGFVDIVVCSRIKNYERLSGQLKLNGAIVIQPLNDKQIVEYLEGLGPDVAVIRELIDQDIQLRELAQSPLMLSIMVLAYVGQTAQAVPDFANVDAQRDHLFGVYVERMFNRRGTDKTYTKAETRRYLNWLAGQMQSHGQSIFQIENLQPTWLGQARSRQFVRFYAGVSTFMTYIIWTIATVLYLLPSGLAPDQVIIRSLLGGTMGMGYSIALTNRAYDRWWMHVTVGVFILIGLIGRGEPFSRAILPAIGFSIFYGVSLNILKTGDYSPDAINPVERLSFSWENVPHIPVILSSFVGAFVITNFQVPFQHPERVLLAYFATLPLVILVITIPTGVKKITVEDSSRPNQGILSSIRNGLLVGAAISAIYFLTVFVSQAILRDIMAALLWGLFSLIWIFWWVAFLVGFAPAFQHLTLRWMLHRRASIPWNYAAFLDHAVRLTLLRRVGGSYTFIHRYLLEYFAALEPEKEKP